ncbi:hypothetical protein [Salipiger sp. 1_MG-2023]|uniref:hypothetical protein n=1 Tax=Salipiger sp. 1_MG-2023 TaxID=3062665 RepID=UPI0026E213B7|nr:hypothetical protein [Salipiger sp. 1_MG-2023]
MTTRIFVRLFQSNPGAYSASLNHYQKIICDDPRSGKAEGHARSTGPQDLPGNAEDLIHQPRSVIFELGCATGCGDAKGDFLKWHNPCPLGLG